MPPRQLQKRLSSEYQQVLRHYDSRQIVYSADESELAANNNPTGGIDKEYQNLYEGADRVSALNTFHMSAGDEIIAVLSENINTDHPSIAKAVVTSPRELNGATVLISFSLANDRISAIVQKLILPHDKGEKGMEISVAGVVKDGLPGIGGDVNRHYATQLAAGVAKAGLIGGTAYGLHQAGIGDDLGEAIVVAPMVQEATQGLTRPIDHWGRAKPATVKASAGQTFTILVTEGFEVKL
jgi:type IV secretory pathway VirB10-like protein